MVRTPITAIVKAHKLKNLDGTPGSVGSVAALGIDVVQAIVYALGGRAGNEIPEGVASPRAVALLQDYERHVLGGEIVPRAQWEQSERTNADLWAENIALRTKLEELHERIERIGEIAAWTARRGRSDIRDHGRTPRDVP